MGEKNILQNPTQEFFPQMLQATRLLILDYDVTRYHSFDLFRYLLLNEEMFVQTIPELHPLLKTTDPYEQLRIYRKFAPSLNPYDNFVHLRNTMQIQEVEDRFNQFIESDQVHVTYTDLYHQLGIIFHRPSFDGYILRYKKDPSHAPWEENVKVYTSDHVLNLNLAMAIIEKHRINAIIVSSIDVALIICRKLEEMKWSTPISFIIGNYAYNFDTKLGIFHHIQEMNVFEYQRKHEFGVFDPFSGL